MKMTGTKSGLIWFCYGNLIQGSITFYSRLKPGLFPIYLSKFKNVIISRILIFFWSNDNKLSAAEVHTKSFCSKGSQSFGNRFDYVSPSKVSFFCQAIHPSVRAAAMSGLDILWTWSRCLGLVILRACIVLWSWIGSRSIVQWQV